MAVVVPVVMMVVVVTMIMIAMLIMHMPGLAMGGIKKLWLNRDNPVQIKPAAAQNRIERHIRALGPMDRGKRIEAAQARLKHWPL